MDHHEQRHQHHEREREERIKHEKERERTEEKRPWKMHPAWLAVVGGALILVAVLIWTLMPR
jgi:hypothetical protein